MYPVAIEHLHNLIYRVVRYRQKQKANKDIMNIYAIGDLHLSGNPPTKPMNIFGPHWDNHWNRIKEHWQSTITDEDIVFLVGDMSWALRLNEALYDLHEIAHMHGQKYMIRGNHDYWWSSANKMKQAMGESIHFLQGHGMAQIVDINNVSTGIENPTHSDTTVSTTKQIIAFGGTRGYMCPGDCNFKPHTDQSIYDRELLRTEAALQEMEQSIVALQNDHKKEPHAQIVSNQCSNTEISNIASRLPVTRILLLHYPPFNEHNAPSGFTDLIERYHVDICIFGHLHDKNSFHRIPTHFGNTQLRLVSADYAEFQMQKIL